MSRASANCHGKAPQQETLPELANYIARLIALRRLRHQNRLAVAQRTPIQAKARIFECIAVDRDDLRRQLVERSVDCAAQLGGVQIFIVTIRKQCPSFEHGRLLFLFPAIGPVEPSDFQRRNNNAPCAEQFVRPASGRDGKGRVAANEARDALPM